MMDWVKKMDKALDKVITKLTKIKEWYIESKEAMLSGEFPDTKIGKYYSEMIVIGQFLSNLARDLLKASDVDRNLYDDAVQYLLNDKYLEGTEEWFETMLKRKIVWDE